MWLTGLAMAICMMMIVALLALVFVQGVRTFWPSPIDRVTLTSGTVLLGLPVREEAYDPSPGEKAELAAAIKLGTTAAGAVDPDGRPIRRLYRVGNKEFRGDPFEWIPFFRIASLERDPNAMMLERQQWGVWFGMPEAVLLQYEIVVPSGKQPPGATAGAVRTDDVVLRTESDGSTVIRRRSIIAEGANTQPEFARQQALAHVRSAELMRLKTVEVGEVNRGLEDARLHLRQAEIDHGRTQQGGRQGLSLQLWLVCVAGAILGISGGTIARQRSLRSRNRPLMLLGMLLSCLGFGLALPVVLSHPWSGSRVTDEQLAAERVRHDEMVKTLRAKYDEVLSRIKTIETEDSRYRVIVREPSTGKFAPVRQTEPDEPLRISQVVRAVQPNTLTFAGRAGVYLDRWREFLLDDPREANSEGGIFPVIFGTVLLTLLLSVAVVPLGVIAALYMREYARQGPLMSAVRVAVNNLAGVPSIVYGVFGLGFFCYSVGQFVDGGPSVPWSRVQWWGGIAALVLGVFGAMAAGLFARPRPGSTASPGERRLAIAAVLGWVACIVGAAMLVSGIPMFNGLYEAGLPTPTFGARGMLWAALTLALLTLPVVIVATEEAIAAVPRTMREGSYGCGASKWQTISRIVLPRAMPGIMTGMILAMARGAGEVAPLMLVGAAKLAPELAVSTHFPFLHLDRSFMHLGFHIYDVGFQSPDAEAARPLVWTITLVLVGIVLLLNLTAIRIRSRLRKRFLGGAF